MKKNLVQIVLISLIGIIGILISALIIGGDYNLILEKVFKVGIPLILFVPLIWAKEMKWYDICIYGILALSVNTITIMFTFDIPYPSRDLGLWNMSIAGISAIAQYFSMSFSQDERRIYKKN